MIQSELRSWRWHALILSVFVCGTAAGQQLTALTPNREKSIRELPQFQSFDKSCQGSFAGATPRIVYTAATLGSIDVDGGKAEILIVHPQCFFGDREEFINTDISADRFYDSGVVVSDSRGFHFLGRSCMVQGSAESEDSCSVTVERTFTPARNQGKAAILKADWTGIDLGGSYRDVLYQDRRGNWFSYPIPDSRRDDDSNLCRVFEVSRYEIPTVSTGPDIILHETLSESKYSESETGTCLWRVTTESFVEMEIREDVLLEPTGARASRHFIHGFALPPKHLAAARDGKTITVASTTPVGLIMRDPTGRWKIEIPGSGRAQADEKDLFRLPSYWGFGAMTFGTSDPGLEARRSKWEERDGEYTCYDSASSPRLRIPASTSPTGDYQQISLSDDGKWLLYEKYEWEEPGTANNLHLIETADCKEIMLLKEMARPAGHDRGMNRFIITRPGWEVSVVDRSGKVLGALGKFNGYSDTLMLSPNGRWALAYGVPGCTILNVESGTKTDRVSAECEGKFIGDEGQLSSK